jgi:hypothetical protein
MPLTRLAIFTGPWRWLRPAVVVAWVSASLLVGLLWLLWARQVLHPLLWPFIVLVAITITAGLAALPLGLVHMRRPHRREVFCWTWAGIVPALLLVALVYSGHQQARNADGRDVPLLRPARLAVACAVRAKAEWQYPHRLEGTHVVLLYWYSAKPGSADLKYMNPETDMGRRRLQEITGEMQTTVTRMDRCVTQMEQILGRPLREKVLCVRGPCLGLKSVVVTGALAVGSARDMLGDPTSYWALDPPSEEALAEAVLIQACSPGGNAPLLLRAGWVQYAVRCCRSSEEGELYAEALQGRDWLAELRPQSERDAVRHSCLRLLCQPGPDDPVRRTLGGIGPAFVAYLLRRYGPDPFIRLCDESRARTFDADCQRILGINLENLEEDFWKDTSAQSRRHPAHD